MASNPINLTAVAVIIAGTILAGCGGNGTSPGPSAAQFGQAIDLQGEMIKKVGFVGFVTRTSPIGGSESLTTSASAFFEAYDSPLSAATLAFVENTFDASVVAECSIEHGGNLTEETILGVGRGVSAGEVISVTTPSGSWPELASDSEHVGTYEFAANEWTDSALPMGTIVDIPGGEFPSFSAVIVPPVEPMSGVAIEELEEGYLQPGNKVMWQAGVDPGALI
jgi:hypothetical protein